MTTQKMTRHEAVWISCFLGVTTAAVTMELVAALGSHPNRPAWTTLMVRHIPKPVALAAAAYLGVWLPVHLQRFFKAAGKLPWKTRLARGYSNR